MHPELEEEPINNRFYDPDLGVDKKKLVRLKRPNFQFVQEGSFAKQAEISRMRVNYLSFMLFVRIICGQINLLLTNCSRIVLGMLKPRR